MTLTQEVARYVVFMRKLGYKYVGQERMLRHWATYAMAQGDRFACADSMIDWAAQAPSSGSACNRFGAVRRLAIWLHAEDPRHEIPPRSAIGRAHRSRPAPTLADTRPDQTGDGCSAFTATRRLAYPSYLPHHDRIDCINRSARVRGLCIAGRRLGSRRRDHPGNEIPQEPIGGSP